MSTSKFIELPIEIQGESQILHGTVFVPTTAPKAWVLFSGATGVPHQYYRNFSRWLASEKQFSVVTFDYRDFGTSSGKNLRQSKASMSDWGIYDVGSALSWTARRAGSANLWVIGHSLGGLLLPMVPGIQLVNRIICVATGPLHWIDIPWPARAFALSFWYGHGPLATATLGYLPGRLFGFGADLPSNVYWQSRKWCTSRGSFYNDVGTILPYPDLTLTQSVRLVGILDDMTIPPYAVWRLKQSYPAAHITQFTMRPMDYGLRSLGHIRVFSETCSAAWPSIVG